MPQSQARNFLVQIEQIRKLHDSKVSRESDLRSVPYNPPVGVRSYVKNAKNRYNDVRSVAP